jgi:hypothetical protein
MPMKPSHGRPEDPNAGVCFIKECHINKIVELAESLNEKVSSNERGVLFP